MKFVIPETKLTGYLLTNPRKSGFFLRCGYSVTDWSRLRDDLLAITQNYALNFKIETAYGKKYTVLGQVKTPSGSVLALTTVWMVSVEEPQTMRFLTAYPT